MENEQNLDWDGGYTGVYICQNSWNCVLEICILFYVNHISVKNDLQIICPRSQSHNWRFEPMFARFQ